MPNVILMKKSMNTQVHHWHPGEQCVQDRSPCLHTFTPNSLAYLTALLEPYTPFHAMRGADAGMHTLRRTKLLYDNRSFSYAGSKFWNSLPANS